jgi:hypothetical protein
MKRITTEEKVKRLILDMTLEERAKIAVWFEALMQVEMELAKRRAKSDDNAMNCLYPNMPQRNRRPKPKPDENVHTMTPVPEENLR